MADLKQVKEVLEKMIAHFPGKIVSGLPAATENETYFYIGSGEKGEKYTLRCFGQRKTGDYGYWVDTHWQDNLDHLGADPEAAITKALRLVNGRPVYFEPFVLQPGNRGPRPVLPEVPPQKKRIGFGQYRDKTFEQLLDIDRGYLAYLARSAYREDVRAIAKSLVGDVPETSTETKDWSQFVLDFGDHRGKTLGEVLTLFPRYVFWLASSAYNLQLRAGAASLVGPIAVPLASVDVEAVLTEAGIQITRADSGWKVEGKTYPIRMLLQFLGGDFHHQDKYYQFRESPLEKLVLSLVDAQSLEHANPDKLDREGAATREKALRARKDFDNQPDCRLSDPEYAALISPETINLLQRGAAFGIPDGVIQEQIIDAGKIVSAWERNEPLFMLASEAGAGKTFVLGAAAREIHLRSAEVRFCYVTLRQGLVKQIQNDLKDYGVLGVIDFYTYNAIGKSIPAINEQAVVIFDEAHTAKNLESKAGGASAKLCETACLGIYASATPYEDPSEMAYLEPSGIFEPHGFQSFAIGHGAMPERVFTPNSYGGTRSSTQIVWTSNADSLKAAAAGRDYLQKRGIYTQRKKRLPVGMVTSRFHSVEADKKWCDMFSHVSQACDYASAISAEIGGNPGILRAYRRNLQKRILEAAKIQAGINKAHEAAADGKQVVMFVETKSSRFIGNERPYIELLALYQLWASFPPGEREYPPPVTLNQLALAQAFDELEVRYNLPSVVDEIVQGLGRDNTGVYVGARAFNTLTVTASSADKDLAAWKAKKLAYLVATMAKGGTGLSLHPTSKNNPRAQIGINLPWKAYGVDQVGGRCARYGMRSKVSVDWLFCPDIPLEKELATKVGARMAGMGASVSGITTDMSARLMDWNMEADEDVDYQGFDELKN